MRDLLIDLLASELNDSPNVVLLTADLGFGIFERFERFRDSQYFNVGVSEQLMASMACGLSLEGFKVFCYSIGVFPTLRCLEQIRNDISYHNSDVTIISSGAGFSYGSLGMSHHCIQDIGYVSSIPGVLIQTPANETELERVFSTPQGPRYLRIDKSLFNREPLHVPSSNFIFTYHKSSTPTKTAILFHGSIGSISEPLIDDDEYLFDLYSVPQLSVDEHLISILSSYSKLVLIEEHSSVNGFSAFISNVCISNQLAPKIISVALDHNHTSVVGTQDYYVKHLDLLHLNFKIA